MVSLVLSVKLILMNASIAISAIIKPLVSIVLAVTFASVNKASQENTVISISMTVTLVLAKTEVYVTMVTILIHVIVLRHLSLDNIVKFIKIKLV